MVYCCALCHLSHTWFSFGFISKNEIKKKLRTENKHKEDENKSKIGKIKNEKIKQKVKFKEIICQFSATVEMSASEICERFVYIH